MDKKIYKTLFFGTPEFSVPVLEKLNSLPFLKVAGVFTQPDKPVGKKQIITPPAVKLFAKKNNLEVWQPNKIRSSEFKNQLKELAPDVIIIIAYGKIIPKNLLAIPAHGWLNVHASLLPKYRGASPIQQSILEGEPQTGVTLMQLDEGMDTGPIITQRTCDISPDETAASLHNKLGRLGAELTEQTLLDYLQSKIKPQPQNNSQTSATKIIQKIDGRIDWAKPTLNIERQLRAYTPWPGVYCFWNAKRLKIIKASVSDIDIKLSPGQINKTSGKILVGTGQGILELIEIQLEGKKVQPIADFLKGYPDFSQTKLS